MRIRCGNCHDTIWVQSLDEQDASPVIRCPSCEQEYDVSPAIGKVSRDRFSADAREFARTSEIDLPAAYSVLLGITSLDGIRDMYGSTTPSAPTVRYDSSFRRAVEAGWLTPVQAAMRGKRELFAKQLVERHGLPEEKAYEVADNRLPLLEAVRGNEPLPRVEIVYSSPRRRWPLLAVAVTLVAVAVVGGILVRQENLAAIPESAEQGLRGPRVVASLEDAIPEVRRNDRGELIEILGGNPRAILDTYCRSLTRGTVDPVAIEQSGEDWTGLYRQNGRLFGITIRRDEARDVWVAGDAAERIASRPITNQ